MVIAKRVEEELKSFKDLTPDIPSGTEIAFDLKDGREVTVIAGRDDKGLIFVMKDILEDHRMNPGWTSEGGYPATEMRRRITEEFLPLFPDELVEMMSEETIRQDIYWKTFECKDKLFLLSMMQVFGKEDSYCREGGSQIDILRREIDRVKAEVDGTTRVWWLRSVDATYGFRCVVSSGFAYSRTALDAYGVVLGFRLNL